ncbi:ATP-binding protein [Sphaerisporangium corydalis]|uniref:ATP-binding protein n=1 Tax=Sphaerisporangium corydalis TaxID=1441875 RepID=A0ABV9EBN9_9ACTN|nr:AAA family ATPase [Sphaerisporangium corydalis]
MRFHVLGSLEVVDGDGNVVPLGDPLHVLLLTILLSRPNETVSQLDLAAELWSDDLVAFSRRELLARKKGQLQGYVALLRRALEPEGRSARGWQVLLTDGAGYRLRVGDDQLDETRMHRLAEEARAALNGGRLTEAARAARAAIGCWRGRPFGDFGDRAFAQGTVVRLEQLRLSTVELAVEIDLRLGMDGTVLSGGLVADLVREHPENERLRCWWALALYRAREPGAALVVCREGRELLRVTQAPPSSRLASVESGIRAGDPPAAIIAEVTLVPPGEADETAAPSPPRGPERVFVGRQEALVLLRGALAESRAGAGRVVLLAGQLGIGKSRTMTVFADHAAREGVEPVWGRAPEDGSTAPLRPWRQILQAIVASRHPEELKALAGNDTATLSLLAPRLADLHTGPPGDDDRPRPDEEARPGPHGGRAGLDGEVLPGSHGGRTGPDGEVLPGQHDGRAGLDGEVLPGSHGDGGGDRTRLFEAVTRFLVEASAARPIVVLVDDLHRADPESLLLLRALAARLGHARLLVIASFRDTAADQRPELLAALADLPKAPAGLRVDLDALDRDEVADFVRLAAGSDPSPSLLGKVHARTGGIPLFVSEILRPLTTGTDLRRLERLVDAGGLGISADVLHRLRSMPARTQAILALAAVIGREADVDLLAAATSEPREALLAAFEDGMAYGVIDDSGDEPGRYRFRHVAYRDALYAGLGPARRRLLHHQVAGAIEATVADRQAHAALLAHHHGEAAPGQAGRTVRHYRELAAREAMRLFAYDGAALHLRLALANLARERSPDEAERCELLLALGEAETRGGHAAEAKEAFTQAAEYARAAGAAEPLARAALGYGHFFAEFGELNDRLITLLRSALVALGDQDTMLRARVSGRLAAALYWGLGRDWRERAAQREKLSAQAVRIAREHGTASELGGILESRCYAIWGPDTLAERTALAEEMIFLAGPTADRELEVQGRLRRILALADHGDLDAMFAEIQRYAALADRLRQPIYSFWAFIWRATLAMLRGRFAEGERLSGEALQQGEAAAGSAMLHNFGAQLWWLRREQGRLDQIAELVQGYAAQSPDVTGWRPVLAYTHLATGRPGAARDEFDGLAAGDFGALPRDADWLVSMTMLAEVCCGLEDPGRAAVLYRLLRPYAHRPAFLIFAVACMGSVSRYLGLLATATEDWEAADQHFRDAADGNRRLGARPYQVYTAAEHGRMLLRRGRPSDRHQARTLLAHALHDAQRLGMAGLVRRITEDQD